MKALIAVLFMFVAEVTAQRPIPLHLFLAESAVYSHWSDIRPLLQKVDIVGADSRRPVSANSFPYLAAIGVNHWQSGIFKVKANGWAVHPRIVVTAAHQFIHNGKWVVNRSVAKPKPSEIARYRVELAGCPAETIKAKDILLGTRTPDDRKNDWAIIILEQDSCLSDEQVGRPRALRRDIENRFLFGSGPGDYRFMIPAFIDPITIGNDPGGPVSWPRDAVSIYVGEGQIISRLPYWIKSDGTATLSVEASAHDGEVYAHNIDLDEGTSGAPLIWQGQVVLEDGRERTIDFVIGTQVAEAIGGRQENYASPFTEVLRRRLIAVIEQIGSE